MSNRRRPAKTFLHGPKSVPTSVLEPGNVGLSVLPAPDPRLVDLVRILAREAAREWFDAQRHAAPDEEAKE